MIKRFKDINVLAAELNNMERFEVSNKELVRMLQRAQVADQRAQIAAMVLQGLLSADSAAESAVSFTKYAADLACIAIVYTDALLEKLDNAAE